MAAITNIAATLYRELSGLKPTVWEALPGKRFSHVKVTAAWPIVRQGRKSNAGFGAIRKLHGRLVAAHLGLHPARMCRIHLDPGVAELVGQVNGKGIQRGL